MSEIAIFLSGLWLGALGGVFTMAIVQINARENRNEKSHP